MLHLKEKWAEEIVGCNFDFSEEINKFSLSKTVFQKRKHARTSLSERYHKTFTNVSLILVGWLKPSLGKCVLHVRPTVSARLGTLQLLAWSVVKCPLHKTLKSFRKTSADLHHRRKWGTDLPGSLQGTGKRCVLQLADPEDSRNWRMGRLLRERDLAEMLKRGLTEHANMLRVSSFCYS